MNHFDLPHYRRQEIEDVLLQLLPDIPYQQITVKDLTDRLQIARKTFYHYFHSKQACLEALMDRFILECNLGLLKLPKNASRQELYAERLRFWIRHKTFLDAVIRDNLGSVLVERILLYIRREDSVLPLRLSTREIPCDEDVLFFFISGQIHLILKWCSEGFTRPLEEMAQKTMRLVYQPLLPEETSK